MKFLIATLAAGALLFVAASVSHAGGYAANGGYGYGYGGHGWMGHYGYGHAHVGGCPHCYAGGHSGHHRYHGFHHDMYYNVPQIPPPAYQAGPPTAAVTYPYYTVRGPRDFLQDGCGPNPILPYRKPHICLPSIGP